MYNTKTFELAMKACSYKLEQVFYVKNTSSVRKIFGLVPIVKKVTTEGKRETIVKWKPFRWNDAGQCFSRYSSKRQRKYDLPLRSITEQLIMLKP